MESTPRIERIPAAQGQAVRLLGDWTAAEFARPRLFKRLRAQLPAPAPATAWDLRDAGQLDHIGAQLLWNHWGRGWPPQLELLPTHRAVLQQVAQHTRELPPRKPLTLLALYLSLGAAVLEALDHLRGFVQLVGDFTFNVLRLARAPHEGPWRDFSGHLYRIGATALPITALVGFLIGVVVTYLTSLQLRLFGADAYVVDIVGIAVVRELGPLLAAILVAGRSGSAITAQIGVMRVNDELDAMSVLGISHGYRLVMPRALALALAMPLINIWTTVAGLVGGILAAKVSLGLAPRFFINAMPQAVDVDNLLLASGKSVVFGVLIALIACHFGLRVQPNTQSLGQGTTSSVVTAITVVILVDALFALLFKDYGF